MPNFYESIVESLYDSGKLKRPDPYKQGGSYLDTETFYNQTQNGQWEDAVRQLGFTNLFNITNFQSPLYQQYAQYLQKIMPQMGVNSLLAPLMANGVSYAGGQAIASQKQQEFNTQRQDKINTGVQDFALGLQNQVIPQIGQIGNSFQTQLQRMAQEDAQKQASSPWGQIGGVAGGLLGNFLLPGVGGAIGAGIGSTVGGYGGGGTR